MMQSIIVRLLLLEHLCAVAQTDAGFNMVGGQPYSYRGGTRIGPSLVSICFSLKPECGNWSDVLIARLR
jgi:hypothetical protein